MPRHPSVRLSRSTSGGVSSGGGGAGGADTMALWSSSSALLSVGWGMLYYIPHYVAAHRMVFAAASPTAPALKLSQLLPSALRAEAKLVETACAQRLHPLDFFHPVWMAHQCGGLVHTLTESALVDLVPAFLSLPPPSTVGWFGRQIVGSLVATLASFPFFVAETRLYAQLITLNAREITSAAAAAAGAQSEDGLGLMLSNIDTREAFRNAFIPHFLCELLSNIISNSYGQNEKEVEEWFFKRIPLFRTARRKSMAAKTKRIIASSLGLIAHNVATTLITAPLSVVAAAMALQGSGYEPAVYHSSLQCASTIWAQRGILGFFQGVPHLLYANIMPNLLATTTTTLLFHALSVLRED